MTIENANTKQIGKTLRLVAVPVILYFDLPDGVDANAYGYDAANETIRELTRKFEPTSDLLDYSVSEPIPMRLDLGAQAEYEENDHCRAVEEMKLQNDRQHVADEAFQSYDFGAGVEVEDASGWEYISNGHEWTRPVFVRADEGDDIGSSQKLVFTVRFDSATAKLEEVYAIDSKGSIWGRPVCENTGDLLSFSDALANITEVLSNTDGEYLAQIYNQICSDKITYDGDSMFTCVTDKLAELPKMLAYDDMTEDERTSFDKRQGISSFDRAQITQSLLPPRG